MIDDDSDLIDDDPDTSTDLLELTELAMLFTLHSIAASGNAYDRIASLTNTLETLSRVRKELRFWP